MKPRKVAVTYFSQYMKTAASIAAVLSKRGIRHVLINREKLKPSAVNGADLVISAGGDGTFLQTACFVASTPMLGVCPDRNRNEGFLTSTDAAGFSMALKKLLKGKYRIAKLQRLEAGINGNKTVPALNEIFIGSLKPHDTARYTIKIGNRGEYQKSSGVIVSTAAGSTAWSRSAGGKILPIESKKFQFVVREPYFGKLSKPKMLNGILNPGNTVYVKSDINDGIVIADSFKTYKLKKGQTVKIMKYRKPLNVVVF